MSTVLKPTEMDRVQRVILPNISWETFERILAEHQNFSSPRFTYDEGILEIMSPTAKHEEVNRTLALLVEIVAEEMSVDVRGLGSTTFKRQDLLKGFEPDSCFYIQSLAHIEGKDEIDLAVDPPPDLLIEIDITSPSLPRFPIFAKVGVPEVWRFDGSRVQILRLDKKQHYIESPNSRAFPQLTANVIADFLSDRKVLKSTAWLRRVRAWAREQSQKEN